MRRSILLAAVLALMASGSALAGDPPNPSGTRLLAGGGRIWEGASGGGATAEITFSGFTSKLGHGSSPADYRCDWRVTFNNVGLDWLDGVTARTTSCGTVVENPTGGAEGLVRCSYMPAELDGVGGYRLSVVIVDGGEGGVPDLVWIVLRTQDVPEPIYNTGAGDFTRVPGTSRTELDAGNFQIWLDP